MLSGRTEAEISLGTSGNLRKLIAVVGEITLEINEMRKAETVC